MCISWSATPFRLGSQVIKFSIKPHQQDTPGATPTSETYLREAVVKYLTDEDNEATFDFLVQFHVDDEKTPIEDPMQDWKEADAPYIKLATITIPAQKFDFDERNRLDEGMSFMAWHTLPEHEPLDSVNLARKKVYQEIVKARRSYAQHRVEEPQAYSSILEVNQEVILSAGSFDSPKLLMLSGIGDAAQLQTMGIPVVADLP